MKISESHVRVKNPDSTLMCCKNLSLFLGLNRLYILNFGRSFSGLLLLFVLKFGDWHCIDIFLGGGNPLNLLWGCAAESLRL